MAIVNELVTLLRYKVDNSGLKEFVQSARTAGAQASNAGQQASAGWRTGVQAILAGFRTVPETVRKVGAGVAGVGRAAAQGWREGVQQALKEYGLVPGQVLKGIREQRRMNAEAKKLPEEVKKGQGAYEGLAGSLKGLVAGYLSISAASSLIGAGDEFGQIEARLKNATTSAEEFAMVDKALAQNSRDSFKPFSANAELFVRTNDVMKALGKTTQDTLDIVAATNLSLAASGADAQKAASFVDQFSKALGVGKMSGESFENMLANNQSMIKYLVAGLNETNPSLKATMANFRDLVSQGKITTDVMLPALRTQMAKMKEDVDSMPVSIGDAMTVLRDKLARMSWAFSQQTGVIEKITTVLGFLTDNLGDVAKVLAIVIAAAAFRHIVMALQGATLAAGGLRAMLLGVGKAAWASLGPYLVLAGILGAIYLIGQDIYTWLNDGDSVLGSIIGNVDEWRGQLMAVAEPLKGIWASILAIGQRVGDLVLGFANWIASLVGLENGFAGLGDVARAVFAGILAAIGILAVGVDNVLKIIVALFNGDFAAIGDIVKGIFGNILSFWADVGRKIGEIAMNIGSMIKTWVTDKIKGAINSLKAMVGLSADDDVVEIAKTTALNAYESVAKPMSNLIGGVPQSSLQRAGAGNVINNSDSRQVAITIQGAPNAAAVGRAAQEGVERGFQNRTSYVTPTVEQGG